MQKNKCIIATTTALRELHHHHYHQINMITPYHREILSDFLSFELYHIILSETRTQVRKNMYKSVFHHFFFFPYHKTHRVLSSLNQVNQPREVYGNIFEKSLFLYGDIAILSTGYKKTV